MESSAGARPYETLLAKGEDRRQRILSVAERLLARNGWRNTSLAQIAREAGVTSAGLLHHFESKEQLLNAVLDARDLDDDTHADRSGDLADEIKRVAERFARAPEMVEGGAEGLPRTVARARRSTGAFRRHDADCSGCHRALEALRP